jgi:NADH-quinone oxidoreductase E subunit
MGFREPALEQPKDYKISAATTKKIKEIIKKYPVGRQRSAVMPALDLVQREAGGWLPVPAMNAVAELLDIPYIKVYEVASFYTMYNIKPVGEHLIQVCRTTPCWLRGSDGITSACKKKLGLGLGETSADKKFTLVEVECLGACVNAPMVQINDDYYEDLTPEAVEQMIDDLSKGKKVSVGTQVDRQNSAPVGGPTTLLDSVEKVPAKKTVAKKAPAKKAVAKKPAAKKKVTKKPIAKKDSK